MTTNYKHVAGALRSAAKSSPYADDEYEAAAVLCDREEALQELLGYLIARVADGTLHDKAVVAYLQRLKGMK